MTMKVLLIDDMRDLNVDKIARTYKEGIRLLTEEKWDVLLLDHDLGQKKTGYDVLCWLEANPQFLPKQIKLVTSNPSARVKMELALKKIYS